VEKQALERVARAGRPRRTLHWPALVAQGLLLLLFWLLLGARLDAQYLFVGLVVVAVSQVAVTRLTPEVVVPTTRKGPPLTPARLLRLGLVVPGMAAGLLGAMLYELVVANVRVALIVLNPRLPISPTLYEYSPAVKSDWARVLLANSVTLTPGTLTVELGPDDRFLVHALTPQAARSLPGWSAERRIESMERLIMGQGRP